MLTLMKVTMFILANQTLLTLKKKRQQQH